MADAKRWLAQAVSLMSPPADKPELLKAQYRAFSQQMPMMYVMLITSIWAVAYTHYDYAPALVVFWYPVLMSLAAAKRIGHWWTARHREPTVEIALAAARLTNLLATLMAIGCVIWTVQLFQYGDAYTKAHLVLFLATAIVGSTFCLMHLRSAALIIAIIVNTSIIIFFASTGQPTLVASAIDIALVSVAMLVMLMINYRDFTRMVDAQSRTLALSNENFRLANLDSLTELPNRRAFFARLDQAMRDAQDRKARLALGIIDLDGFKPVNDLYGHPFGDKLLVDVGQRLAGLCVPDEVYLARLGGDEFALIIEAAESDAALLGFGLELCEALREPFTLPEATVQIAGTIGFAVYPELADSSAGLFERADYALYDGKRGGRRGSATLFSAQHAAAISRDAGIEQALQMADLERELEVVFQPIVDISDERTVGFEALARWTSPVLGRISPAQFIPIAERLGIIGRLTRCLLRKALVTANRWPDDIRLSFNLSAHDLSLAENVVALIGIVEKSGFNARRLDLEITESAFGHDFAQVVKAADQLKMLGCGISLDDFGTGYSSLSRLHALPLTKIKIDRSFIVELHRNPASVKIVKSLLALSRDMGLDCVIEGVEMSDELAELRKLGSPMVQGYFYSPPVSELEVDRFIRHPAAVAS